jgi:hypothetical protein
MKPIDIIIIISAIAAVVGVIGWQIYKKKTGKGCGCGCGSCPHATACHAKKTEEKDGNETCTK